jgi:hypothetical protein
MAEEKNGKKRPTWFLNSEGALRQLIDNRNKAIKHYEKNKSPESKKAIQIARQELKKGKERAKTLWLEGKITEIEKMNDNQRNAWNSIKDISKTHDI